MARLIVALIAPPARYGTRCQRRPPFLCVLICSPLSPHHLAISAAFHCGVKL